MLGEGGKIEVEKEKWNGIEKERVAEKKGVCKVMGGYGKTKRGKWEKVERKHLRVSQKRIKKGEQKSDRMKEWRIPKPRENSQKEMWT